MKLHSVCTVFSFLLVLVPDLLASYNLDDYYNSEMDGDKEFIEEYHNQDGDQDANDTVQEEYHDHDHHHHQIHGRKNAQNIQDYYNSYDIEARKLDDDDDDELIEEITDMDNSWSKKYNFQLGQSKASYPPDYMISRYNYM